MSDPIHITVFPDGPYKISDATSVSFCGEAQPVDGDVFLCRCGNSSNAPFCDGTHSKGFDGSATDAGTRPMKVWEGATLRTHFNANMCMHARYCRPLNALRERELAGDTEAATEIARVVDTCPSGALTWEAKSPMHEPEAAAAGPQIDIMEGGEVRIQAAFDINTAARERQPEARATLCRCGLSNAKPWCDGHHKGRRGFR